MVKIKMCNNGQKSSAFFSLFYISKELNVFLFLYRDKRNAVSLYYGREMHFSLLYWGSFQN